MVGWAKETFGTKQVAKPCPNNHIAKISHTTACSAKDRKRKRNPKIVININLSLEGPVFMTVANPFSTMVLLASILPENTGWPHESVI